MFENFTEKAIKAMMLSQEEAHRLRHDFVGTGDILLGLIGEGTDVAAKILRQMGVNLKSARIEVERIRGQGSAFGAKEVPFTPKAKNLLKFTLEEANRLNHNNIGTGHLLLGLLCEEESTGIQVLKNLGLNLSQLRFQVVRVIEGATQIINQVLNHILQALQQDNPEIQRQAIQALRYIGNQEQIELLTQLLNSNVDQSIQLAAIEALGAIGTEEAENALLSIPRDKEPLIRWKVDEVLDKLLSGEKLAMSIPPPPEEEELVTIIN